MGENPISPLIVWSLSTQEQSRQEPPDAGVTLSGQAEQRGQRRTTGTGTWTGTFDATISNLGIVGDLE